MCMCKNEEEKEMLAQIENVDVKNTLRKPKRKRTNLLSSATDDTFKIMNEISKKNRGISNLTHKNVYGGE